MLKNIYGIYKRSRDASWKCLIDYNITSLPVDLIYIADKADIKILKNSILSRNKLDENEAGRCIYVNKTKKWYIIYDDSDPEGKCRLTIAHEFGHIFLGHELVYTDLGRIFYKNKPKSETEADIFAARLLAPACVLWGLDVRTPDAISKLCVISNKPAELRAKRMSELYKRDKFLTSVLERKVYGQFKTFIRTHDQSELPRNP